MSNKRTHRQHRQPLPFPIPDGVKLIGADINIMDNRVTVSREEYDSLLYSAALVDILERLYKASGKYAVGDLLDKIFSENKKEEK